MGRCSKDYFYKVREAYQEELEQIGREARKDFEEMDLENAKAQGELGTVLEELLLECRRLTENIEAYKI